MPLGILDFNGRPFALGIIAQAGREDLMFQFMSAFERIFPKRQIPKRLLDAESLRNGRDAEAGASETSMM
jgi:amidase